MKKEILVFIFDGYADWESSYVCSKLNEDKSDYIVKTISFDKEPKISMGGFHVVPDYSINDYPAKFSMLLLLGGDAWIEKKNNYVEALVKYAYEKEITIGAICGSTLFLGELGYLDNIKHTSNTVEFMKSLATNYKGEANYIEKQAVSDGNIITANGTAGLEFAREILLKLNTETEDKINEWYEFHKKGFYKEV